MWSIELDNVPYEADIRELLMAFYINDENVVVSGRKEDNRYIINISFNT